MKPPTNVSPFMTVDEVAAYCRQHPKTIQKWCQNGTVCAKKLGKSWMIHRPSLDAYLGIAPEVPQSARPTYLRAVE